MRASQKRELDRRQSVKRANVVALSPLTVDVFGYSIPLTLDNDFELSQWMKLYQTHVGLKIDDVVLMHQDAHEWFMIDVVSDGDPAAAFAAYRLSAPAPVIAADRLSGPAEMPAAPVTLGDVICLLQSYGLCAKEE